MLKNGRTHPGSAFQITATFQDTEGNYEDPEDLLLKVMSPCGTETTYTMGVDDELQQDGIGRFHADLTPDKSGRWRFRWDATFAGPSTTIIEDSFIVQASKFSPYGEDCCMWDYR